MTIENTKKARDIRNVAATMAIENMHLSETFVEEFYNSKDNFEDFIKIFTQAVVPLDKVISRDSDILSILTSDDLNIGTSSDYDYYGYNEHEKADIYDSIYQAKISEMDAKKKMSDAKEALKINN